jgi:DNA excision repair protein ERCC-3
LILPRDNPLVVQGDGTLLLEAHHARADEARDRLQPFAELVKRPEYVHTWRITPLSLWNAAAAGHPLDEVLATLDDLSRFPVPASVRDRVRDHFGRYGRFELYRDGQWLLLVAKDPLDLATLRQQPSLSGLLGEVVDERRQRLHPRFRGELKRALTHAGYPVADLAGYEDGDALALRLVDALPDGSPFTLRDYQRAAVDAYLGHGLEGGSGVVVLPCGAGKTVVGLAALASLGMRTLILCPGHSALQQWRRELLEKTTLTEAEIGEYTGRARELRPVTLATYQLLTWRPEPRALPPHLALFQEANWGLVIYDEVHLLPAPVFRETAGLQARRRLGLTATLVREDGAEEDVFSLVGPKRFDLPWKLLERQGWIARAECVEVRVSLSVEDRVRYASAGETERTRIASANPRKGPVVEGLLRSHPDAQVLVLGTYLEQLEWLGRRLGFPVLTGKTPVAQREALLADFREGRARVLGLSKVGNAALDLPDAEVAIQVSGSFGSRQEEAQRLGRLLRPKAGLNRAVFYSVVSAESREQDFSERRQLFLAEQGYPYQVRVADGREGA